jgi:large subunit ribosomal protein L4
MLNMPVQLVDGGVGSVELDSSVFGVGYNESLVHQVIIAFLANARQGTRAQKDRSEVNKSTKKPWKQKGTGRARAGRASSPLWRGGGRIFPNRPDENFSHKVNKKMYRSALRSMYSHLIVNNALVVLDAVEINSPKTKEFKSWFEKVSMGKDALIVVSDAQLTENLYLSSRNFINSLVVLPHEVNPYLLSRFGHVLVTKEAISEIQGLLV